MAEEDLLADQLGSDFSFDDAPDAPTPTAQGFKFVEYHKIDSGGKGAKKSKLPKEKAEWQWVVLEKVHGANFSFYCDGKTLTCSRRSALLNDSETFFDFQTVRDKYRANIFELYNKIHAHYKGELHYIAVYGELFGGFYPHPSIPDLGLNPVQKQIYYYDKIDFYAFDIRVHQLNEKGEEEQIWLDYDLAMKLFKECGFFYAEPLFTGSLEECLAFNYAIPTTIPSKYGLPPLETKNICEGVIVKSLKPIINKNRRTIFKLKNPNFLEINPKHESVYDQLKAKRENTLTAVYNDIERYINSNRVISLRSKIGEFGADKLQEVTELILKDVVTDFCIDFPEEWKEVETSQERVIAATKSKVSAFILEWLAETGRK